MPVRKSSIRLTVIGLLMGILMASMDNTIVSTALSTIVADLGGMEKFAWVSSIYMMAGMVVMPIFGKLSDMFGRKRFFTAGLGLFLIGSILCACAHSMPQLIVFRGLQGLGGGAIMPIAFTIIFDVFPVKDRGKMSGLFSTVFGISSIIGPLVGALLADYASWHWIFLVNVPLGLCSLGLIARFYDESVEHREQKIDWFGAAALTSTIVCLMLALQTGGKTYNWTSWQFIGLVAACLGSLVCLMAIERKAADPIIPLALFKNRLFAATQSAAFFTGAVFILFTIYIPVFVQGVTGGTATNAGLILMPMMLANVVGSQLAGWGALRKPYRDLMLVSAILLLTGTVLMGSISGQTSQGVLRVYMIVVGLGIGISFPVLSMSSTHNMPFQLRATTTSAVNFYRTMGMTLGIAVFGAIQKNSLLREMQDLSLSSLNNNYNVQVLLKPEFRSQLPVNILGDLTAALSHSILAIFHWALIPVALALVTILLMGKAGLRSIIQGRENMEVIGNVNETGYSGIADGGGKAPL